jgi:chlorite dismutase
MEHAKLGMAYGAAELAHDVRLACHGLDTHDNEFVLGVLSKELHPLSRLVQDMRKTQQTSKYIQSLGPFFVGQAFYRSGMKQAGN